MQLRIRTRIVPLPSTGEQDNRPPRSWRPVCIMVRRREGVCLLFWVSEPGGLPSTPAEVPAGDSGESSEEHLGQFLIVGNGWPVWLLIVFKAERCRLEYLNVIFENRIEKRPLGIVPLNRVRIHGWAE